MSIEATIVQDARWPIFVLSSSQSSLHGTHATLAVVSTAADEQ
jgi:hypothetical protein